MYAAVLFIGITNATAVQPVVSIERFVSYRERAAGMYSGLAFAFAQVYLPFSALHMISRKCALYFLEISWFNFCFLCRLPLSSLIYLHNRWFTVRFSTLWPHLSGLPWNLFGTYSLCTLLCYISPFMEWWLLLSHRITMWLLSSLLRFICCGTFSAALWFPTR